MNAGRSLSAPSTLRSGRVCQRGGSTSHPVERAQRAIASAVGLQRLVGFRSSVL